MKTAPAVASTTSGAWNRPTKAERTSILIMAFGRAYRKGAPLMDCATCQTECKKFGKTREGHQRYRCRTCRKTYSERPERPLGDMRLPVDRAVTVLHLLCEGSAVRAVERITGTDKKTILRLLVQVGDGCEKMLA